MEARDGCYQIQKTRLWEDEETYGWVKHMAEKGWVNINDFAKALRIARRYHRKHA